MSHSQEAKPRTKVYIEGRYRKLSRDLPQTLFYCPDCKGHPRRRKKCERCEGFGKLTRDSVQELVAWVAGKAFGTRKNKFHGAGREDVDVRMLGDGRPFVLELINPKVHDVDLAELEATVNSRNAGRMEIRNLHWTERSRIALLKETHHAKLYGALVESEAMPAADRVADLLNKRWTVVQSTPERVAHRRARLDRERWVELTSFEPVPQSEQVEGVARWRMELLTQHGTYVKEALSGEEGRTKPSIASLLDTACRCVELDVLGILDDQGQPLAEFVPPTRPTFGAGLGS